MANSTKALAFFDTNILIYQFDKNSPDKRTIAQDVVDEHQKYDRAVISMQVIQEFMNVALKKFDSDLLYDDILSVTDELLVPMLRLYPSVDFCKRALDLFRNVTVSFYDTMIIQAALDLDCDILYSEDLQDGRTFGKLKIVNPFKEK
jgi:predicted nucleic acid-binding protein